MKALKNILVAVSLITLAACSAMPATQSGFLSQDLTVSQGVNGQHLPPEFEISWQVVGDHGINKKEQEELKALLKHEIKMSLEKTVHEQAIKIPTEAIQIRAAITRIEAVSPALNWLTIILLFVPMDHGGAAVELEAVDVRSNKVITQLRFASWTPIIELKAHFTRLAPANLALTAAAHEFVRQLVAESEF